MVERVLPLFTEIFSKCASWTSSLLGAVGGKGVLLAAFSLVLAITLLFLPMRGRMGATSFVSDYQVYKNKKEAADRRERKKGD